MFNNKLKKNILLILFLLSLSGFAAAKEATILFIQSSSNNFENQIINKTKKNISDLLASQFNIKYQIVNGNNNHTAINQYIRKGFADPNINIIINIGIMASQELANMNYHPKPSIASLIIDERLQNIKGTKPNSSNIHNLTFVRSQYNVFDDIKVFHEIYPYKNIAFVFDEIIQQQVPLIQKYLTGYLNNDNLILINKNNYAEEFKKAKNIDAVYIGPLTTFSDENLEEFANFLIEKKLPSFSMIGRRYTEQGILASQSSKDDIDVYSRRIALNVLKILEGQNPSTLPVRLPNLAKDPVINLETARRIGIYPNYDVLKNMDVLNPISNRGKVLSLEDAISEALKNNLDVQLARKEYELSNNEKSEALRAFLPSISLSTRLNKSDRNSAESGIGARVTHNTSAELSQILFSEQALGVYKARKLNISSQLEALRNTEMDIIYNTISAYLNFLNAKRELEIQQENVNTTRRTLDIAKNKQSIGYSGLTDVYRLESELASNQSLLTTALANVTKARLNLKNLINRPLKQQISLVEIDNPFKLIMMYDDRISDSIQNDKDLEGFINYTISKAQTLRPDLLQLEYSIAAQKRLLQSEKRARYMPTLSLGASTNQLNDTSQEVFHTPDSAFNSSWNANITASLPLVNSTRTTEIKRLQLNLDKLNLQKKSLVNGIDLSIRSDVETTIASFQNMELAQKSADSAEKSYNIVNDNYRFGRANITDFLDAQNNALSTKLNAVNAQQGFILDFLQLERDIGFYYFIASDQEKAQFLDGLNKYIDN